MNPCKRRRMTVITYKPKSRRYLIAFVVQIFRKPLLWGADVR